MQERRGSLRAPIHVLVSEKSEAGLRLACASNICECGVHYIDPGGGEGAFVQLEFSLPEEETSIRARGRVVYRIRGVSESKTAVAFTALAESDAERIRCYVGRCKRAELLEQIHAMHLA